MSAIRISTTAFALCGALGLSACDKGDDASGDKAADGGEGEKAGDGAAAETPAEAKAAAVDPKDAEIAALKAEVEAANEAIADAKGENPEIADQIEGAPTPEDEVAPEGALKPGEKGPVSIANLSVEAKERGFSGKKNHRLAISADITLNEKKDGGVYAKASCAQGEEVFVNVTTVSSRHSELGKMNAGDTKRLEARLFSMGLDEVPARCDLAFDYGAESFSTRIADFCWDGKKVTDGKCTEAITPRKEGNGKVVPFGFKIEPQVALLRKGEEGKTGIEVVYAARFNEAVDRAPHLHLKSACKAGDKTWVEVNPEFPHVKPFALVPGEAVPMRHRQFFLNALPTQPEHCDVHVLLDKGFDKPEEELSHMCWKPTGITEGACDANKPPPAAHEPMTKDSIEVDEVAFEWAPSWRDKDKLVLKVQLAATVKKPIADKIQLVAQAKCGRTEDKQRRIGPDLEFVEAGESVAVRMSGFRDTPFDKAPRRCEITFAGKKFASNDQIEVERLCLNGNKVKQGKCGKGKGKGKGKDAKADAPKGPPGRIFFKKPKP